MLKNGKRGRSGTVQWEKTWDESSLPCHILIWPFLGWISTMHRMQSSSKSSLVQIQLCLKAVFGGTCVEEESQ